MTATEYLSALSACVLTPIADIPLDDAMNRAVNQIALARDRRATVHLVGNGGSASVVAHVQNDLVKACGIKAMVYQDVPLLTALANDQGYGTSYSNPLSLWLDNAEDVLIAVSSSGASPNILNAVRVAPVIGTITCSGFRPDNPLRKLGRLNFYVPSSNYGQVELTHAALLHYLTDRLAKDA